MCQLFLSFVTTGKDQKDACTFISNLTMVLPTTSIVVKAASKCFKEHYNFSLNLRVETNSYSFKQTMVG